MLPPPPIAFWFLIKFLLCCCRCCHCPLHCNGCFGLLMSPSVKCYFSLLIPFCLTIFSCCQFAKDQSPTVTPLPLLFVVLLLSPPTDYLILVIYFFCCSCCQHLLCCWLTAAVYAYFCCHWVIADLLWLVDYWLLLASQLLYCQGLSWHFLHTAFCYIFIIIANNW